MLEELEQSSEWVNIFWHSVRNPILARWNWINLRNRIYLAYLNKKLQASDDICLVHVDFGNCLSGI